MTRKSNRRGVDRRLEDIEELLADASGESGSDDVGNGPRELSDKEREHIDAILDSAREENPEALAAAERQLERERESGELAEARERDGSRLTPFNAGEKSREHGDGLSDGERELFDALGGGYEPEDEPESESGDGGPIIRLGSNRGERGDDGD